LEDVPIPASLRSETVLAVMKKLLAKSSATGYDLNSA